MANPNKVFTTLNQPLGVEIYSLVNPDGAPQTFSTLEGVPLGTADGSSTGEIGAKVIIIGDRSGGVYIPQYDSQVFAYVGATNNVATITYFLGATQVALQTFTYAAAGAADNDLVTSIVTTY